MTDNPLPRTLLDAVRYYSDPKICARNLRGCGIFPPGKVFGRTSVRDDAGFMGIR